MARRSRRKPIIPFAHKLVLNQWIVSLFGVKRFDELAERLRDEQAQGLDENNVHRFHHELTGQLFESPELPKSLLMEYDQNIVAVTQRLNAKRVGPGKQPFEWKYFQYLTLLFTEIYLDRYFRDPVALRSEINQQIALYNADKPPADCIDPFDEDGDARTQLNKIAFWSATGSGKTLIMHANVLQHQHYLEKHGRRHEMNRIILLTPNEGLSRQHVEEFNAAGISAELFKKEAPGLYAGRTVEVLDIHKLKEDMGDKTVAVDAFESNNLVLIDEGHRGASGGESGTWMKYRNALCEKGFSFEYSATFGQAVKNDAPLTQQYARCILFDYSYKYFYGDGFGKDYQILNLDPETQAQHQELYLVACLLAFYQQARLFRDSSDAFKPFNVEKPLWVFVGGSVTKTLSSREASDIVEILRFLARFVQNRQASVDRIDRILTNGLVTANGRNLFANRFTYLHSLGVAAGAVFDDVLRLVFNAPGGGSLHVENLKGATGEIALRVGDNEPFGVVNVGDDAKLVKRCDDHEEMVTGEREFAGSLFHAINHDDSTVNLLIGSRKFTEGWNSWRVSTMGLMNIGATEGSQIIQLFGRGVRLKGFRLSLKRSGRTVLPEDMRRPRYISLLETLNIFGIKADYMAQFRAFLEEEGLPPNDDRLEMLIPVIRNLGTKPLRMIRLKKEINGVTTEFGDAFRRLGPIPTLAKPDPARDEATAYLQRNPVVLNWYPKVTAIKSMGVIGGDDDAAPHKGRLTAKHLALVDYDRLFFEMQRYKAERGWHNFNISRDLLQDILLDGTWYTLYIPAEELAFDSYEKVRLWEEIALALLKGYSDRYYKFRKQQWELPHLEYQTLLPTDPNFPPTSDEMPDGYHRVLVEQSQTEIIDKLNELKTIIESGKLRPWEFRGMKAIWFGRHLYEPLLHVTDKLVEVSPVALNKGEMRFVEDLKAFHDHDGGYFDDKELYLLRNLSRGRGVGFFEAGNFHPDFIVWQLVDDRQFVSFVDPKGIRHLSWEDPKIRFYRTIKEIEVRLGDPKMSLSSFIVSNTSSHMMRLQWHGKTKADMEARNILFQDEDPDTYIRTMLTSAVFADRDAKEVIE